jgi:hypothetical protein
VIHRAPIGTKENSISVECLSATSIERILGAEWSQIDTKWRVPTGSVRVINNLEQEVPRVRRDMNKNILDAPL